MYVLITLLFPSPCQADLREQRYRVQGTKATVVDGHTITRGASRPDRGATAMVVVAAGEIPALVDTHVWACSCTHMH